MNSQRPTNALINESSPYLLQHAHNPVQWQPWNPQVIHDAKASNKMLIISIGYAACHWCHVMEHECFEDEAVAQIMNDHFICIKVDREERPDIDQIYMNAAQLITGRGGWPLNAFALPDGRPFYAGTYFPKDQWIDIMQQLVAIRQNEPARLEKAATEILNGINAIGQIRQNNEDAGNLMVNYDDIFSRFLPRIDLVYGGEQRAPKFPMPAMWEYLLQYHYVSKNSQALEALNITLTKMAYGGIYDHLAGGFARYSTDEYWFAPHFEKMLYDNAQLISLFAHAYQQTGIPLYKNVVQETLAFVSNELTSPEGVCFSSLDADSEGEEGKFYVWSDKEIETILGSDSVLFNNFYHVLPEGNWEHGNNILHRKESFEDFATNNFTNTDQLIATIEICKAKLLAERNKRVRPGLDDKVLTSWNALMVIGYIDAFKALGNDEYLQRAEQITYFLMKTMWQDDGNLLRNFKDGKVSIEGMLDDYAFLIAAMIALYEANADENLLLKAKKLTDYTLKHFWDSSDGLFFYTHERVNELITRSKEISDNVIPSSNAVMANNLYRLGHYLHLTDLIKISESMVATVQHEISENIYYHAYWGGVSLLQQEGLSEVSVTGGNQREWMTKIQRRYLPHTLFSGTEQPSELPLLRDKSIAGKTSAYLCKDKTCSLPFLSLEEFLQLNHFIA